MVHAQTAQSAAPAVDAPKLLDRASVVTALTDYVREVNFRGYQPDYRKVLAVRESDRTATLRNAVTPVRWEAYYYIEGELFPDAGATCLHEGETPQSLAGRLVDSIWEQLWVWNAYDFTPTSSGLNQGYAATAVATGGAAP